MNLSPEVLDFIERIKKELKDEAKEREQELKGAAEEREQELKGAAEAREKELKDAAEAREKELKVEIKELKEELKTVREKAEDRFEQAQERAQERLDKHDKEAKDSLDKHVKDSQDRLERVVDKNQERMVRGFQAVMEMLHGKKKQIHGGANVITEFIGANKAPLDTNGAELVRSLPRDSSGELKCILDVNCGIKVAVGRKRSIDDMSNARDGMKSKTLAPFQMIGDTKRYVENCGNIVREEFEKQDLSSKGFRLSLDVDHGHFVLTKTTHGPPSRDEESEFIDAVLALSNALKNVSVSDTDCGAVAHLVSHVTAMVTSFDDGVEKIELQLKELTLENKQMLLTAEAA